MASDIIMVKDQGRKEMFYLTTHSTHFIYGYVGLYGIRHNYGKGPRKEGNVLFNDTLNTFYLVIWHQVYGK